MMRFSRVVGLSVCFGVGLSSACAGDSEEGSSSGFWSGDIVPIEPEFSLGSPAPNFALTEVEVVGMPAAPAAADSLGDLLGEVVFIDFWGAWCRGCVLEHDVLVDLAARYADRGVIFLGVTADGSTAIEEFVRERGVFTYPLIRDDG